MCGIVAANAERNIIPILIDGLRRLEYRGYDSAGLACLADDQSLFEQAEVGKVADLVSALPGNLNSRLGIAHTRWATHGAPTRENAHPHMSGKRVAVVHNGIIENFEPLKRQLEQDGYQFRSETDTEVIAHLIDRELNAGGSPMDALRKTLSQLDGAYAIAVLIADFPDRIFGARQGSPLVVGVGVGEHFLASDAAALVPVTQQMLYLEDGDLVEIRRDGVDITRLDGSAVDRPVRISSLPADSADRGNYPPLHGKRRFTSSRMPLPPPSMRTSTAPGSARAWTATCSSGSRPFISLPVAPATTPGLVARYWIEQLARIPVSVEIASEYRYREPAIPDSTLLIAISQSGENRRHDGSPGPVRRTWLPGDARHLQRARKCPDPPVRPDHHDPGRP